MTDKELRERVRELEAENERLKSEITTMSGVDYDIARNSDSPPNEVNSSSLMGQRDRATAQARDLQAENERLRKWLDRIGDHVDDDGHLLYDIVDALRGDEAPE